MWNDLYPILVKSEGFGGFIEQPLQLLHNVFPGNCGSHKRITAKKWLQVYSPSLNIPCIFLTYSCSS